MNSERTFDTELFLEDMSFFSIEEEGKDGLFSLPVAIRKVPSRKEVKQLLGGAATKTFLVTQRMDSTIRRL